MATRLARTLAEPQARSGTGRTERRRPLLRVRNTGTTERLPPDYVINAGGITDVHYRGRGMSGAVLRRCYVARIGARLSEIFSQSAATGKPTGEIADRMAEAIFRAPPETDRAA